MSSETKTVTGDDPDRILQWEAKSQGILNGYEPWLKECRWKGMVSASDVSSMRFWARDYRVGEAGDVELFGVLFDTSDRLEDVVLTSRMTWYFQVILCHVAVIIFPYQPSVTISKHKVNKDKS